VKRAAIAFAFNFLLNGIWNTWSLIFDKNFPNNLTIPKRLYLSIWVSKNHAIYRVCRGRDHMVVGFTTTFAISAYHHKKWCIKIIKQFKLEWLHHIHIQNLFDLLMVFNALSTIFHAIYRVCRGRDHMVVGFTTTFAISAYHH
jgi:hypothetical protein